MKQSTQQRLNQLMSERNLKQIDILNMSMPLQERTGIKMSKSHLSQYVNGKSSPDQHKLHLLSKTLNVSEAWLLGYDVPKEDREFDIPTIETIYNQLDPPRQTKVYDFAEYQLKEQNNKAVPLLGGTAANPTELSYGDSSYGETVEVNVPEKADCALVVKGDSMEPEYYNGDIVFYKTQPVIENGEIAIVEINGDGVTLKKVYFNYDEDKVILRSLNDKYADRELTPEQVRILGKVVK